MHSVVVCLTTFRAKHFGSFDVDEHLFLSEEAAIEAIMQQIIAVDLNSRGEETGLVWANTLSLPRSDIHEVQIVADEEMASQHAIMDGIALGSSVSICYIALK
jgi:hypothetical protein